MNPVQRPDFYGGDYTGAVRRRWPIVVALTLVGVVGAFGYIKVTRPSYMATAAVYVTSNGADHSNQLANARTSGAVDLDTEAQLVTSGTVTQAAAHLMHSTQAPSQLDKEIAITVPPNADVLDISCSASSAAKAAACANAFAQAYLHNRSSSATSWLNAQLKFLQGTVRTLQQTAAGLHAKIGTLRSNSSTRFSDQAQLRSDESLLHLLNIRITTVEKLAAEDSGSYILTYATPPSRPNDPRKSLVLPSGFFAGLVLGLIGAVAWDRRDKRIRNAADAERFLALPVLLNRPNAFKGQASLAPVRSATGQAFIELAHGVAAALGEGNHVLLVAGASPGPAGSVTAANLAVALARTHSEAVLVCTDPDSSVSPEMLGLDQGRGLAEVMAGSASVRDVARGPATVPGLWVITPGGDASLVDHFFMPHDRAQSLVWQLRRDARYVIIEAQATEGGADTFALAEFADAALVTVEASRTSRTEADACVRRLQQLRAPVIGVAVLAAIRRGVRVRPPQQDQPPARRGHDELLAAAAALPKTQDRDGRSGRYSEGRGDPADKIWGS